MQDEDGRRTRAASQYSSRRFGVSLHDPYERISGGVEAVGDGPDGTTNDEAAHDRATTRFLHSSSSVGHLMRTLHLIDSLGPGGAERSLIELVASLREHSFEPTVAYFERTEVDLLGLAEAMGVRTVHIAARGWIGRVRAVRRLVRGVRPSVLHTTIFRSDIVGRVAAIGTDAPVLTSIVNTSYEPVRLSDARVRRSRLLGAQIIDAITAHLGGHLFHAISQAVASSAVHRLRLDPESVIVVPRGRRRTELGEPSRERRASARALLGIAEEDFVVLQVGREDHQKGHVDLLSAFFRMREQWVDATLVLAGRQGNASQAIDDLLARRGSQRVLRLGHSTDVPELLAAADVFVFPSLYEGLGGALLEAMAMEVPIVATAVPALVEVVEDDGIVVPPGDPPAIARAVAEVRDDPMSAHERARAARRRFDNQFESTIVTAQMVDLFHTAAQRRHRR